MLSVISVPECVNLHVLKCVCCLEVCSVIMQLNLEAHIPFWLWLYMKSGNVSTGVCFPVDLITAYDLVLL